MRGTPHPPELRERAIELRAQGLGYKTIVKQLGVPYSTVLYWVNDDLAEKTRERKAKNYRIRHERTTRGTLGRFDG